MPTEDDNTIQTLIPEEIANKAINRNLGIAQRLQLVVICINHCRIDEAVDIIEELVKGLAESDADLRTLRDTVTKTPGDVLNGELPYSYTRDDRCVNCGNPLRYPLMWNRTTKDTGEHICAVGECSRPRQQIATFHE